MCDKEHFCVAVLISSYWLSCTLMRDYQLTQS